MNGIHRLSSFFTITYPLGLQSYLRRYLEPPGTHLSHLLRRYDWSPIGYLFVTPGVEPARLALTETESDASTSRRSRPGGRSSERRCGRGCSSRTDVGETQATFQDRTEYDCSCIQRRKIDGHFLHSCVGSRTDHPVLCALLDPKPEEAPRFFLRIAGGGAGRTARAGGSAPRGDGDAPGTPRGGAAQRVER